MTKKKTKATKATIEIGGTQYDKQKIYRIAKIAYETNRGYCQAIGDFVKPEWIESSPEQKDNIINGVIFQIENMFESDPREAHDKWMSAKLRDGWKYDPTQDEQNKTHPCLLPYDELSSIQQAKDLIFATVVQSAYEEFFPEYN